MILKNLIRKVRGNHRAKSAPEPPKQPKYAKLTFGDSQKIYPVEYEYYLHLFRRQGVEFRTQSSFETACLRLDAEVKQLIAQHQQREGRAARDAKKSFPVNMVE